jgi:hypothetical protein
MQHSARPGRRVRATLAGAFALLASIGHSQAAVIWANDALGGSTTLRAFDSATGALIDSFTAPNAVAARQIGRGIAVIGAQIFYTVDTSGDVFLTNAAHADLGVAFSTGLSGIGALASDGASLYLTPSNDGDDTIYRYSFAGVLLDTITATPSTGTITSPVGRTGLELVGDTMIANQGNNEGPYDVFDLAGTLLDAAFLPGGFGPSGVTFDGSTYYVADVEATPSTLLRFDATGAPLTSLVLTDCPGPNDLCDLQDLSVVLAVPEPGGLLILASALAGFALLRRRAA